MSEVIEEAEIIIEEAGTELAVRNAAPPATLFGTDDPVAVIEKATQIANALAKVIEDQKLYTIMGTDKDGRQRRHVKVEGWTLLGSMLGVFPETEWTRETKDSNGNLAYAARVVARTRDGMVVGAREAMCSKSEPNWRSRDDYAIKSMAQTRATSGALAQPLRFIVVLAGFEGTPESEMPRSERETETRRVETTEQVKVPRSWEEIIGRMKALLGDEEAMEWLQQAKELKEMNALEQAPPLAQRLAGAVVDLTEAGHDYQFLPNVREIVQKILAARLDGCTLEGPPWALTGEEAKAGMPAKEDT